MRLGSNRLIDVDVKIISATNADIPAMIEQKLFRADLYYRLSTMQLYIPPLQQSLRREQLTREKILEALEQCGGNRSEAARLLGVARKTLYRNMERLGLE